MERETSLRFNLGGDFISGPKGTGPIGARYGIYSNNNNNITVMNGTVANCFVGITFNADNPSGAINYNHNLQNLLVTNIGHHGINFQSTDCSRVSDCVISNVGSANAANGTFNAGLYLQCTGSSASRNVINDVTGGFANPNNAEGIFIPGSTSSLVAGNQVFNCYHGIYFTGVGKYQDNLTLNCQVLFSGGIAVGTNN